MMTVTILGLLLYALSVTAQDVSVSCMMAYDEGGAVAVFQSPECPQWVLPDKIIQNQTKNCQFATVQGHRDYQEDRVTCNLDLKISMLGKDGLKDIVVGVLAIFDGHGGKEASEMASEYLLDFFLLHVIFCSYKQSIPSKNKNKLVCQGNNTENGILTVGSTQGVFQSATVVLLLMGEFLVANIGDSKALLCSYEGHPATILSANELTRDHHPSRNDEKARIKAAGGFVRVWGVPRVNGVLAVSRSIGDIYFKRYGVIAIPEVRDWESFKSKDRYLVVASDGIFESLTSQDVCKLIQEIETYEKSSPSSLGSSLAGQVVNTALRNGSMDNLSAIVVPLGGSHKSPEYAA